LEVSLSSSTLFDDELDGLDVAVESAERSRLSDREVDELVARAASRGDRGDLEQLSALSAFQRQAERFPLLSSAQQAQAVELIRAAERTETLLGAGQVPAARRRDALRQVEMARAAREHLAASVWRLAWLIVRESANRRYGTTRAAQMLPDLMGEANVAIAEAIATFAPSAGPSFATYASRLIRDRVRAVVSKGDTSGLPPSWLRLKRIWATRGPELVEELGRAPTTDEIQQDLTRICLQWARRRLTADQLMLAEVDQLELMYARLRKQGMIGAIRDIEQVLRSTQTVVSLDAPVGDESASPMDLADPDSERDRAAFDATELAELTAALHEALDSLSERERTILLLRFGFDGGHRYTYQEISQRYDVTAERIRQIEKTVLGRLRDPSGKFAHLAAFLPSHDED
jgi:RNA polymerase primary sigma factor